MVVPVLVQGFEAYEGPVIDEHLPQDRPVHLPLPTSELLRRNIQEQAQSQPRRQGGTIVTADQQERDHWWGKDREYYSGGITNWDR